MVMFRLLQLVGILAVATAYTAPNTPKQTIKPSAAAQNGILQAAAAAAKPSVPKQNVVFQAAATAALALMLSSPLPAAASSNTAAQISLNALPPTTVDVSIQDLPVVGNLLSGTYTKVSDGSIDSPSVTIKSPKDKVAAVKSIATGGHLEFDVGGILNTHLDVDIAADKAGVATVRVASPLIPKLPFKNLASSAPKGGKPSEWSSVTNLGNGETYYFNDKTGMTQFEKPDGF